MDDAPKDRPEGWDRGYKRGMEDAMEIAEERAKGWGYCAENKQYWGLASKPVDENSRIRAEEAAKLAADIRAKIQESDDG